MGAGPFGKRAADSPFQRPFAISNGADTFAQPASPVKIGGQHRAAVDNDSHDVPCVVCVLAQITHRARDTTRANFPPKPLDRFDEAPVRCLLREPSGAKEVVGGPRRCDVATQVQSWNNVL